MRTNQPTSFSADLQNTNEPLNFSLVLRNTDNSSTNHPNFQPIYKIRKYQSKIHPRIRTQQSTFHPVYKIRTNHPNFHPIYNANTHKQLFTRFTITIRTHTNNFSPDLQNTNTTNFLPDLQNTKTPNNDSPDLQNTDESINFSPELQNMKRINRLFTRFTKYEGHQSTRGHVGKPDRECHIICTSNRIRQSVIGGGQHG